MIAYQGVVPKVGDYVVIEGDESDLLGMVSNVVRGPSNWRGATFFRPITTIRY